MNHAALTRRGFLGGAGAVSLGAAMTACGFGVGEQTSEGGGGNSATLWDISVGDDQEMVKGLVKRFNDNHPNMELSAQFQQNDPYKNKLRVALGSGNPPDIFYGWGGGVLQSQVDAGKVAPLGEDVDTSNFLPAVLGPVTLGGTLYGVPETGTQPIVFYYNKPIFEENGIEVPQTWSGLLDVVSDLNDAGVTPISLAGQNKWPGLKYYEWLVDRIGGPEVFGAVVAQEQDAWSHPAFQEATRMIQELVRANAFPDGFTSINYDTGDATQLVYTGEAAMQLMGSWDIGRYVTNAPDFLEAGNLGYFKFPQVEGGEGDPNNAVGNPSTYYSITTASQSKDVAKAFFNDAIMSDEHIQGLVDLGQVPPVKGVESMLQGADQAEYLTFIYEQVEGAPHYQMAWDQALAPDQAQELLTNVDLVFLQDITPEQFSNRMNKTISG